MFYWKEKTENELFLTEELLSCSSMKNAQIASAFISREGISIIRKLIEKYDLSPEQITLYLSEQFSSDNPGELLEQLCNVS